MANIQNLEEMPMELTTREIRLPFQENISLRPCKEQIRPLQEKPYMPALPKKFALIDNNKYLEHAVRVLDIVQKNSGAIELNTSGWFKACTEAYPALAILQAACQRNIPVAVNADAHCAEHLQRNFAEGYELLKKAVYKFIQE